MEPTILQVIDRIGAWAVLVVSEWRATSIEPNEMPVATAQRVITGEVEIPVEFEATESWEDEIE